MKTLSAVVGLVLLTLTGCAYDRPIAVSTSSLGPEHEETRGYVNGKSVEGYFLGMRLTDGQYGMKAAVEDAKERSGADNLINITVDERVTYYPFTLLPLYRQVETIVHGTAVRYKDPAMRNIKNLMPEKKSRPWDTPTPTPKPDPTPPTGAF